MPALWTKHACGWPFPHVTVATLLKTEVGSLPEGKVKIKLEHDGTVLDVDEDDVEKVRL